MRLKLFLPIFVSLMFACAFSVYSQKQTSPIQQLRIYKVPTSNLGPFHDRFRDHAHRIMRKYDFHIIAIWDSKTEDKVEFIYLLEWKDEETMKEQWAKFMADQEWKDIKKETSEKFGTFVDSIEDRTLIPTDYSPLKYFGSN